MSAEDFEKKFAGKWVLDRSENLKAYVEEVGINEDLLKILEKSPPETQTLTRDGNSFHYIWEGPSPHEYKFSLGEEFHGKDTAGNNIKIMSTMVEGKWCTIMSPLDSCAKVHNIVSDIANGELIMKITVNKIICKRMFKKIE